jgi:hypothetical protein
MKRGADAWTARYTYVWRRSYAVGHWLETHAWLAAWLALPVAIVVGTIQSARTKFEHVDWARSLIYIAFLTALAVAFTPTFDASARAEARYIVAVGIGILIVDMKPRTRQ